MAVVTDVAGQEIVRSAVEHARGALTWLFVPGDRPERFAKAASRTIGLACLE